MIQETFTGQNPTLPIDNLSSLNQTISTAREIVDSTNSLSHLTRGQRKLLRQHLADELLSNPLDAQSHIQPLDPLVAATLPVLLDQLSIPKPHPDNPVPPPLSKIANTLRLSSTLLRYFMLPNDIKHHVHLNGSAKDLSQAFKKIKSSSVASLPVSLVSKTTPIISLALASKLDTKLINDIPPGVKIATIAAIWTISELASIGSQHRALTQQGYSSSAVGTTLCNMLKLKPSLASLIQRASTKFRTPVTIAELIAVSQIGNQSLAQVFLANFIVGATFRSTNSIIDLSIASGKLNPDKIQTTITNHAKRARRTFFGAISHITGSKTPDTTLTDSQSETFHGPSLAGD